MKIHFFIIIVFFVSCTGIPKDAENIQDALNKEDITKSSNDNQDFEQFKASLNKEFSSKETSPLIEEDLQTFKTLAFFPYNKAMVFTAKVVLTPETNFYGLPTTTSRLPEYRQYALLQFNYKEKSYELPVYQGKDLMHQEGYEDYLFLPFSDATNGEETYGGGRYLDLRTPKSDTIIIDFNKAYNPYCAYNHKYSCPKIPAANNLPFRVEAGIKKMH